jgi:hypothetical protein
VPPVLETEIICGQDATAIEYLEPHQPPAAALINLSTPVETENKI